MRNAASSRGNARNQTPVVFMDRSGLHRLVDQLPEMPGIHDLARVVLQVLIGSGSPRKRTMTGMGVHLLEIPLAQIMMRCKFSDFDLARLLGTDAATFNLYAGMRLEPAAIHCLMLARLYDRQEMSDLQDVQKMRESWIERAGIDKEIRNAILLEFGCSQAEAVGAEA